jgi:hypothetical protein
MLIGLEGAHGFYVSIFRGFVHLRELKAGEPHPQLCTSELLTKGPAPTLIRRSLPEYRLLKKMASAQFGTDRTPEALIARVPGGKTGTKAATSSARRGALPMSDVAACVKYHITRIGVVRHDGQNPHHEPLRTSYATSEPCLCAWSAVTGEVTGNCSTVAC